MIEYINVYLKDEIELSFKEWNDSLNNDIEIENSQKTWNIRPDINTDLSNGRTVHVNGHSYAQKTNMLYDSSRELFEDLLTDDPWIIIDIIKNMSDKDIENILLQVDRVKKTDNEFLLKYEEE